MKYKVKLVYFRKSGKFCGEGEYETDTEYLWEIWEEIIEMFENQKCPGFADGVQECITLVNVPGHPHEHPHLIIM